MILPLMANLVGATDQRNGLQPPPPHAVVDQYRCVRVELLYHRVASLANECAVRGVDLIGNDVPPAWWRHAEL